MAISFSSKVSLLFQTAKHLKAKQLIYQIRYRLSSPRPLADYIDDDTSDAVTPLEFIAASLPATSWQRQGVFTFLNVEVSLGPNIDWNYQEQGKLWNYNLQYANYLQQPEIPEEEKIQLMRDQYAWLSDGRLPLEPYPSSLRAINMIRWMSQHDIRNTALLAYLYGDLSFLFTRLEYHLLGNHLLENAFALVMGGAFFSDETWLQTGRNILEKELEEQVLSDGAHFELSPMYHQIIFFRVLELIDWYSTWDKKDVDFEKFLRNKASDMLAWLANISFENGDIPHFNDSANGIAYSTEWLFHYADKLGIVSSKKKLEESGYRSITRGRYELKIDFAQIGPSYQPGHAHADALSFILYYKGTPLLVEQGTSTYQIGPRRSLERSTQAHNTVVVNNADQSEVWGGFRVARRAKTMILQDGENGIYKGKHDGYRRLGTEHSRAFETKVGYIRIVDRLSSTRKAEAFWHLHPNIGIKVLLDNTVTLTNGVRITFEGTTSIDVEDYQYAEQYNTYLAAKRLVVFFSNELITTIIFEETEQ